MLERIRRNKDVILTGAVVALTITVIVVNRRTQVVTDVFLSDTKLCVEYRGGQMNMYDLS